MATHQLRLRPLPEAHGALQPHHLPLPHQVRARQPRVQLGQVGDNNEELSVSIVTTNTCICSEDIKPPPELLQTLLRDPAPSLHTVKEEAAQLQQLHQLHRASCPPAAAGHNTHPVYTHTHHSGSSSPVSPVAAVSPLYTAPAAYQHPAPAPALHHNQLEEKFQKFRLDCQPQFQDSGGSYLQHTNPATPTTGPYIYIYTIYTITIYRSTSPTPSSSSSG